MTDMEADAAPKSLTARYAVQTCEPVAQTQRQVVLIPALAENRMGLWVKTPTGHISTLVTNAENADFFKHGGVFDVTFTPVNA